MRIFYSTDHPVRYPVGGASIVIAETEERARELLSLELSKAGLEGPFTLREITGEQALILRDGDY